MLRRLPRSTLFPTRRSSDLRTRLTIAYSGALVGALAAFGTALYVARRAAAYQELGHQAIVEADRVLDAVDRKSTRLNSSHSQISYAVFCLKKKTKKTTQHIS